MKYAPMRFDGLDLRHNPEKLIISGKNHIREYTSPCCEAASRNLGRELRHISGEGELCGADCMEQYRQLEALQKIGKRARLSLPRMESFYAYLKELSLTAQPLDNVLGYRFVFVEAQSRRAPSMGDVCYQTEAIGESLWDIADAYQTEIEQLVALNPQIADIEDLKRGERVRIC